MAYNIKGYKSVTTKKCLAEILGPAILDSEAMCNFKVVCDMNHEQSTSLEEPPSTPSENIVEENDTINVETDELNVEQACTETDSTSTKRKPKVSRGRKRKSVTKVKEKGKK